MRPDLIDLLGVIALVLAVIAFAYMIEDAWIIRGGDMIGPI
jgi:hypothetical protein